MRIFVISEDQELVASMVEEFERLGCSLIDDSSNAQVIIADSEVVNVQQLVHAARSARKIDVLLLLPASAATSTEAPELFDAVTDIAVKPLRPGDVTARLRLIDRRRRAGNTSREQLLAMAVEAAGDVVEITDPNTVLQYVNSAFEKTLGYSVEEAIGSTPAQLFRSRLHDKEYFQAIEEELANGRPWSGRLISKAKDGRLVHFDSTLAPVFDDEGRMTHHIAVKRNVTDRIAAEAELRATNDALEQARDAALAASRAKSQFLANMSHELRTPLNAIIGYSEMLTEEAEDLGNEVFISDLGKIRSAGAHLLALINDILDLSKIEAGHTELFLEMFDLRALIHTCVATLQPMAHQRGNQLVVEYTLEFGELKGDLTKIRQAMLNLMSNANKFTERGPILIRVRADEAPDGREGEWFAVEVTDTGIGMTDEQQQRLFKPFAQADASTTRKYGGTGLGLVISQRFCEMMGGHITVASAIEEGSTFTIHLPRYVDVPSEAPASARPEGARHRVLVIDDDPTTHDILTRTLGDAGFQVDCVENGPDGLLYAQEQRPDVIVLDVLMPGMDGWAVLASLKQSERTSHIPVIMLTVVEKTGGGMTLGAADFLVKPVSPREMVRVVRSHCEHACANVLLVEDDPATREVMRRTLTNAGHEVREAENGRIGLEMLANYRPDLIVLDLLMPEVDGFMFLEQLMADDERRDIPVVVATAKVLTPEDREKLHVAAHKIIEKNAWTRRELMQVVSRRVGEVLASRTNVS